MKMTERDKVMALLLPGVAVFAIYGWFVYPPKHTALNKAQAALADAQAKAPELNTQVLVAQSKLARASYDLKILNKKKQEAQQAWDKAAGYCTDARLRNERIEKLDALLARHRLRVIEDAEADASSKDGKVAPAVEGLCQELAGMSAQLKPQLRKVRMVGRYLDVLGALDALATREVVAIPVGLMMKEAHPNYNVREWVLLVWI
jgi:hypothetical protein